jgi:AraC-like DNA-binding protein
MLTFGIAAHAWRQRSFGLACLAAWMATLAATAWVIVGGLTPGAGMSATGRLLIPLLSTPAGPLLYGYVLHASRGTRLHWGWFVPAAAHLVAALALGTALNQAINLHHVIWLEYLMLVAAWWVWCRTGGSMRDRLAPGWVLGAATALALANVLQTLSFMRVIALTPFVAYAPFGVVAAWALVAIVIALAESPSLRRLARGRDATTAGADAALFERIGKTMLESDPWAQPDFDVGGLARLLDTHPNAVSRALSRAGHTNFYDFVNGYRLREAERLLSDPRESRVKIEALGRQAGFRARSTFFKLFRQHSGQTPAEYRASRLGVPGDPSGPPAH